MNKKLFIFSDGVYPFSTGGSHRYIYELAKHLSIEATVVVPRLSSKITISTPTKAHLRQKDLHKIKVKRFRYNTRNKLAKLFSYLVNFRQKIVSHTKSKNVLINIQYLPALASIMFTRKIRVSYFFHGPWSMEYFWNLIGRNNVENLSIRMGSYCLILFLFPFLFLCEFVTLRRASRYFVTTFYMKKILNNYFLIPSKYISVVGAGVDTSAFKKTLQKDKIKYKIVTLRRLEKRMGLEILIEACAYLKKNQKKFYLEIGGRGPMHHILEQKIKKFGLEDNVKLVGFVPEDSVDEFLGRANLFILPSETLEGFGLVVLESFACGTPVIAFRRGGPEEILSKISKRFIVDKFSPVALGIAINNVLENTKELQKFNYRQFVERNYDWKTVAEKIVPLL